jgi:hypothetical protein
MGRHNAKRQVNARLRASSSRSIPSLPRSAIKASDWVGVIRPLRSAIARTFVISMNHQAGTRAVSVANRFGKAVVFGLPRRGTAKPWRLNNQRQTPHSSTALANEVLDLQPA